MGQIFILTKISVIESSILVIIIPKVYRIQTFGMNSAKIKNLTFIFADIFTVGKSKNLQNLFF